MENLPANGNNGQFYGYTLYETDIYTGGELNSRNHVRDRSLVRTFPITLDPRFILLKKNNNNSSESENFNVEQ